MNLWPWNCFFERGFNRITIRMNKDMVKLVEPMYPCQDVPVVVFDVRCPKPCLYCDLYQREFSDDQIIAVGVDNVLKKLKNYSGAYFSAVSDCFLEENRELTHYLLENIFRIIPDFVPLVVTKQIIPDKTIDLLIGNKDRVVVQVSIPSLNDKLLSVLEPGAAVVADRLKLIKKLISAGVPVLPVIMPWFEIYEAEDNIEDLPRALAEVGVTRCTLGTSVLPEKQRKAMIGSGNGAVIEAVNSMTESREVVTKTGYTLPLGKRMLIFGRLVEAFKKHGIKARICSADNVDMIGKTDLPICTKFKHPLFRTINKARKASSPAQYASRGRRVGC